MAVLAGGQTWGLSTKREEDKKHVVLVKLTDAALKAINQHNKTKVRAKGRVWGTGHRGAGGREAPFGSTPLRPQQQMAAAVAF